MALFVKPQTAKTFQDQRDASLVEVQPDAAALKAIQPNPDTPLSRQGKDKVLSNFRWCRPNEMVATVKGRPIPNFIEPYGKELDMKPERKFSVARRGRSLRQVG
jgi:hypothetical protein